jgi:hypothetical protein
MLLTAVLACIVLPFAVWAAAVPAAYDVRIVGVLEEATNTYRVEFQVKSTNGGLGGNQSVALRYDPSILTPRGINVGTAAGGWQSTPAPANALLPGWEGRYYAARDAANGYLLMEPVFVPGSANFAPFGVSSLNPCPEGYATIMRVWFDIAPFAEFGTDVITLMPPLTMTGSLISYGQVFINGWDGTGVYPPVLPADRHLHTVNAPAFVMTPRALSQADEELKEVLEDIDDILELVDGILDDIDIETFTDLEEFIDTAFADLDDEEIKDLLDDIFNGDLTLAEIDELHPDMQEAVKLIIEINDAVAELKAMNDDLNTDLATAMLHNTIAGGGTGSGNNIDLSSVSGLEDVFAAVFNISVEPPVVPADSEAITNLLGAGAAAQIEVVGAGLNAAPGERVRVSVRPSANASIVIPPQFNQQNAIPLDITYLVNDVSKSGSLDVPIVITLPIPESIDPARLTILHFSGGTTTDPTQITPVINFTATPMTATFAVTNFSEFVMVNPPIGPTGTLTMSSAAPAAYRFEDGVFRGVQARTQANTGAAVSAAVLANNIILSESGTTSYSAAAGSGQLPAWVSQIQRFPNDHLSGTIDNIIQIIPVAGQTNIGTGAKIIRWVSHSGQPVIAEEVTVVVLGCIFGNGEINLMNVLAVLDYSVGRSVAHLTEYQIQALYVTGGDAVDLMDVLRILDFSVGRPVTFAD